MSAVGAHHHVQPERFGVQHSKFPATFAVGAAFFGTFHRVPPFHSIHRSCLRPGLRRTSCTLRNDSANGEIRLSFGERPLTSYPGFRPSPYRVDYLQLSPAIQLFFSEDSPSATGTGFFRYSGISPTSTRKDIVWHPSVISAAKPIPHRVIPTLWASIAAPGRSVPYCASHSAICVFVDGFRLPTAHHCTAAGHSDTGILASMS